MYKSRMINADDDDDDYYYVGECGSVCGIIGKENQITWIKSDPIPMLLRPLQI
jgi:hypothetical protein